MLAGFSQGCAIALQTGLRQSEPLAGIIALSGYLPLADRIAREHSTATVACPIFMAHGKFDPVVPVERGQNSCTALRTLGYAVQWHEYPMEHAVCAEELRNIAGFLKTVLGAG